MNFHAGKAPHNTTALDFSHSLLFVPLHSCPSADGHSQASAANGPLVRFTYQLLAATCPSLTS